MSPRRLAPLQIFSCSFFLVMAEQLLTACQAEYNCIDTVAKVLGKEYGLPGLAVKRGEVAKMAAEY